MAIKLEKLSSDELRETIEDMWSEASSLKYSAINLQNSLEYSLDPHRGRKSGGYVTLSFCSESLEAKTWLMGYLYDRACEVEKRIAALFDEVDEVGEVLNAARPADADVPGEDETT